MTKKIGSEPAFLVNITPIWNESTESFHHPEPGLTKREYIAALLAGSEQCPHNVFDHQQCVDWTLRRADALLEALEASND